MLSWDAGEVDVRDSTVVGSFEAAADQRSLIVVSAAHEEPLLFPTRADVDRRLDETEHSWRAWAQGREYEGAWREAVVRSALALKLLVFAPSGAIAAAATTSLPEDRRQPQLGLPLLMAARRRFHSSGAAVARLRW